LPLPTSSSALNYFDELLTSHSLLATEMHTRPDSSLNPRQLGWAVTRMIEIMKCLEIFRRKQFGRPRKEQNNKNTMDLGGNYSEGMNG
jgi:hypothetical protein